MDSVLVYDTHHEQPLAVIKGLHLCTLNDAAWSPDGHALFVCSTDGFLSIVRFAPGELGQVYHHAPAPAMVSSPPSPVRLLPAPVRKPLPPCEPGPVTEFMVPPPTKRTKTVCEAVVSPPEDQATCKRPLDEDALGVGAAVHRLSLSQEVEQVDNNAVVPPLKKMKKRVQPVLLST
jgi:hypothetical protein